MSNIHFNFALSSLSKISHHPLYKTFSNPPHFIDFFYHLALLTFWVQNMLKALIMMKMFLCFDCCSLEKTEALYFMK